MTTLLRSSRLLALVLVPLWTTACGSAPVITSSEGNGTKVTAAFGIESVVFGALEIREHQRLAHDLYDQFSRQHVEPAFRAARDARRQNIDSLGRLLRNRDSFNVASLPPRGQFDDPALAAEYERLSRLGSESPTAAFRVAALIEERDVALIREYARQTSASDVTALYSRLERSGRVHLSSFVTRLRTLGEQYPNDLHHAEAMQALLGSRASKD